MGSCFSSYQVQRSSAKASSANCLQSPYSQYSKHEPNEKDEESSKMNKAAAEMVDFRQRQISNGLIEFSYSKLSKATHNFRPDKIIGDGGFGNVYKGKINLEERNNRNNTLLVAIKKLDLQGHQGDKEWMVEIVYLGSLQHPNLVKLIGFCSTIKERLLVYEYMEYGSLDRHLFYEDGHALNWNRRMKIILDVAKGLAFLHGADRPIIYRDFKTSNILLDKNLNAKISDFGLVKEGPQGSKSHVTTRIMGTNGYAAPEYVQTGKLTYKHDIYGFGVVLLEILTGRTAIDMTKSSNEKILVEFAKPYLVNYNKLKKILDPRIQGQYRREDIHEVAILASKCLSPTPKFRPSINEIVQQLEALRI